MTGACAFEFWSFCSALAVSLQRLRLCDLKSSQTLGFVKTPTPEFSELEVQQTLASLPFLKAKGV